MSDGRTTEPASPAATETAADDRACDRFEDELWAGRRPSIEAFIGGVEGPARADLLARLIDLEVAWRRDADERPEIAEYLGRFPADADAGAVAAGFPTRPGGDAGDATRTVTVVPAPDVVLGGRYRLLDEVGGDGMGVIWLARDALLHRDVALKEIRPRYASSPEMRMRFHRETRVTAKLDHPGIVTVHDLGERDGGDPFYVMHLIRGEDLRKAIRRLHGLDPAGDDDPAAVARRAASRLDLHALVGRLADACLAVAYAHRRMVIHRDLKPGNIMLGPFGETFVIDWGLTKRHERPSGPGQDADADPWPAAEPSLATATDHDDTPSAAIGRGPGTLGYMPPEQLRGDPDLDGYKSDIFSLGATLYCLLTGHRPFTGAEPAMIEKTLACDFPPPRKLRPAAPEPLEAICLKAMAARPADRYYSARALAEDLARWLADEPILARPEPLPARASRWARRHRTAVVAAAVLLMTSTLSLAVFGAWVDAERRVAQAQQKEADAQRATAEENRKDAEAQRKEADKQRALAESRKKAAEANFLAADGAIRRTLAAAEGPDLAYLPGAEAMRSRLVASTIPLRRKLLEGRPGDPGARFDLAHALRASASIDELTGPKPEADASRREAVSFLSPLVAENPTSPEYRVELAYARVEAAESLRALGKPREAEAGYDGALDALGSLWDGDPGRLIRLFEAIAHLGRASAMAETGRAAESRRAADRSFALLAPLADDARSLPYEVILIARVLTIRADAARRLGDAAGARKDLGDAIKREMILAGSQPYNADARFALAAARVELALLASEPGGSADEVAGVLREAVPALNDLMKQFPRNPAYRRELASAVILRGGNALASNRLDPAEKDGSAAVQLLEINTKSAPDVPDYLGELARAHELLARVALARKKPADAAAQYIEALKCLDIARRANPEHPDYLATQDRCRAGL